MGSIAQYGLAVFLPLLYRLEDLTPEIDMFAWNSTGRISIIGSEYRDRQEKCDKVSSGDLCKISQQVKCVCSLCLGDVILYIKRYTSIVHIASIQII